jgi:CheY-like chemotaxis protein
MGSSDRLAEFEARLAALKHKMESGLVERAQALREMAHRLELGDDRARKEIKTESHKLRGVAGSYGHDDLTEVAAELEQRASISPPATVGQMARELADLAEAKGRQSKPPAPVRASDAPPQARGNAETNRRVSERPIAPDKPDKILRVLAMDDDPVTQRLLLLTLQQVGGFDATIVASASAALALLERERFDVVVSDAMMPDMNGRDFRSAARAAGANMPIVILSAASPDELGWAHEPQSVGVWLRKPFKPTELVQAIARIVAEHGR